MDRYKVFITGCARNVGKTLEKSLNLLVNLRNLFSSESIFCFIENDSIDNTMQILETFKSKENNVLVYSFNGLATKKPLRTDRLAFCRNFALNLVRTKYSNFDYYIVVDLDNIIIEETIQTIPKCFEINEQWDALFANSLPKYYDIWALRSKNLGLTYDCWDAIRHHKYTTSNPKIYNELKNMHITKFQTEINQNTNLIPVESAFNGLGIYCISALTDCKYIGIRSNCDFNKSISECYNQCCEHVSFHKGMIDVGRKLFIAPFLLVNAQLEHL